MSRHARIRRTLPYARRRHGFALRGVLIGTGVVGAALVIAWFALPRFSLSSQDRGPMLHTVKRGEFIHDVTERGNVESASNIEIRCQVQSQGMGGNMILELVAEGTYVQPGDVLAKLDSSSLENQEVQQQIVCNTSEASVIQARNSYETAVIAKKEYLEGEFLQSKQMIESRIFVAQENERRAQQYLEYSKELRNRGYVTDLQVQADSFAVEKAQKERESAETELMVLEKYTKDKTVKQLDADIKTTEARLKSEEHSHQLDLEKLALVQTQIENCVIKAPEPGQVVYANQTDRHGGEQIIIEEGTMVRERQVMFRLPDPKRMQVKANINESRVSLVAKGMSAKVRLDAFPDMELTGTVEKVSDYPAPTSFFSSNVKEYETLIKIDGSPEGLRPGLTAEVKIRVERLPDVVQVPVQAVFQHGGKNYCIVYGGPTLWDLRLVSLGSTNDKFVVINSGVNEGEKVVLGATAYRDKVNLPALPPGLPGERPESEGQPGGAPASGSGTAPAASPGASASDPAQAFKTLDQNGDGKLETNEIPERLRARVAEVDVNKDGAVDQGEFAAAMRMMSGNAPKGKGGQAKGNGRAKNGSGGRKRTSPEGGPGAGPPRGGPPGGPDAGSGAGPTGGGA